MNIKIKSFWISSTLLISASSLTLVTEQSKVMAFSLSSTPTFCGDVLPPVSSGAFGNPTSVDSIQRRNDVISSFKDSLCVARKIQDLIDVGESLSFYRYFTQRSSDTNRNISKGSYITSALFTDNLSAVTELALDKQFGNDASSREIVDLSGLSPDTEIYQGVAGPQPAPPQTANACYPGGAPQTYVLFRDAVLGGKVKYTFNGNTTRVQSACIANIPEPSSLPAILVLASLGAIGVLKRSYKSSKIKEKTSF